MEIFLRSDRYMSSVTPFLGWAGAAGCRRLEHTCRLLSSHARAFSVGRLDDFSGLGSDCVGGVAWERELREPFLGSYVMVRVYAGDEDTR